MGEVKYKKCAKCGVDFTCNDAGNSCWCNQYQLTEQQLKALRENYNNCLCESCIATVVESK